jgi:hypothetical protein
MCREFCAYFSAPGRLFSDRALLLDEAVIFGDPAIRISRDKMGVFFQQAKWISGSIYGQLI